MMASAVSKVFAIPELLEKILLEIRTDGMFKTGLRSRQMNILSYYYQKKVSKAATNVVDNLGLPWS